MSTSQFQPVDREAIWTALFDAFAARLTAPPWLAGEAVTAGTVRIDPQGHLQQAQSDGTCSATPPAIWDDSGGTTADGSGPTAFVWQDTGAGFVSIGRKHKAPPDLGKAEQPALFVIQRMETSFPQQPPGYPAKIVMHGYLILYLPAPLANEDIGDETHLAITDLNNLFFAIDKVLEPDNAATGKFTLGGLVTHCWIQGDAHLDPGILGQQAAAIRMLHVLVD